MLYFMVMEYFIPVFVFLFGTLIGSFLNVVIFRHNTGRGLGGRSGCLTCNKALAWYELIPIVSFLLQRGKCRKCSTSFSILYPAVELFTGVVFLLIFSRFVFFLPYTLHDFIYFVSFYAIIFSLLIVIAGYDIRHKIIPNTLVYPFIGIAFLGLFLSKYGVLQFHPASLSSIFAGFWIALPLLLLFAVSRGKWLGFGDVKLAVGMGLLLGVSRGFSALILSFWIGAVVSVIILLLTSSKKVSMKTEIPFAPFLILGTMIAFFFDIHFLQLMSIFQF